MALFVIRILVVSALSEMDAEKRRTPRLKAAAGAPEIDDKTMGDLMLLRADICIHGCYYVDTDRECPLREDGIPTCKRDMELLRAYFLKADSKAQAERFDDWTSRMMRAFWDGDLPGIVRIVKEMCPDKVQEMIPISKQEVAALSNTQTEPEESKHA